jgi:hypothetical protein
MSMKLPRAATEPSLSHRAPLWARAPAFRRTHVVNGVLSLAVLVIATMAVVDGFAGGHASPPAVVRRQPAPHESLSALPLAAQGVVSATLGADSPAYRVSASGAGFQAHNPAQGLRMRFASAGVRITTGRLRLGLSLRSVGYGSTLEPVGEARPSVHANEVTYARRVLREWYRNGPLGLEQGFTIVRPPRRRASGPLTLSLALSGDARATVTADRSILTLARANGSLLRYGELVARDDRGRRLRSWLTLSNRSLLLRVDAHGARYPLRIDPMIQLGAKLTEHEEKYEGPYFGYAVALSADGTTALIGADVGIPGGEAWVFTRSGATWSQQGPELTVYAGPSSHRFGTSVALSADGNIALIGDPTAQGAHEGDGAAWVFIRVDNTWTEGPRLIDEEDDEQAHFGASVALSADGNTALIGGPGDHGETGAAWVFAHSGTNWAQQAKLVGEYTHGAGASVALSADGDTALIGSQDIGALVFTRSGVTWTRSEVLGGTMPDAVPSVALSADGNTALVGEPSQFEVAGAAWVFTRVGSTWTPGTPLDAVGDGITSFGSSVALSADGDTALIGGGKNNGGYGAAWVFRRVGASWVGQTPQLTGGEEENGAAEFGASVALSGDGNFALVGAPNDTPVFGAPGYEGAVWAFASAPPSAVTSGTSNVGSDTATLNSEVDPNGLASTAYFQYGTTEAYGQSTVGQSAGSAESAAPFADNVAGLAPDTTYHFRIVAESSAGTSYGDDQTFTTAPSIPVIPAPIAPGDKVTPTISGTPIRGQALSVAPGSWSNGPTSFAYQWQSCDAAGNGCSPLSGATEPTRILSQGDVGRRLRAIVTAGNAGGSSSATSTVSPVVGSQVEAAMTWNFGWSHSYTIVESLIVHEIPAGGTVEVLCRGLGCPFAHDHAARAASRSHCRSHGCKPKHSTPPQTEVGLTRLFKGHHLGVGTHITVNVTKAGWVGKSFLFTMRANHAPHIQIACLAPGSSLPGGGC